MIKTKDLVDLEKAYLEKHGKAPNVIRIARGAEHDLELPSDLRSRAMVDGVRNVLSRIHGMRVQWDADRTEVDYEEPMTPFVTG
jgi:hypothetical protein